MKVSPEILNLVPYKPGKPIAETQREYGLAQVYKLASNENALGPSPKVIAAIKNALDEQHRYPDPSCYELIQKISKVWNLPAKNIGIGNGSNELIDLLIRIYSEPGAGILTSQAAFVAYHVCAQASRVNPYHVPLTSGMKMDVKALVDYFNTHAKESRIQLVFIPNPNNPTGTYLNSEDIRYLLQHLGNREDVLLVFDEAYNEFVRAKDYQPASSFFAQYSNIVILRTFSKVYGMAGLRLGVMVAPEATIDLFNRVRNPFNVNDLAQVAALAAIDDAEYIHASQELVWSGLDFFYQELSRMKLPYIESQANFVLFDTLRDVNKVNEALLRRGIILRPVTNYGFRSHMRMSVGTRVENEAAILALQAVLREVVHLPTN